MNPLINLVPEWYEQALCTQVDPELFFPEKGLSPNAAKQVCKACPVREKCLDAALAGDGVAGIWGGTSASQRARMRRRVA